MRRRFTTVRPSALAALALILVALPSTAAAQSATATREDFTEERVGAAPTSFSTPTGFWSMGTDGVNTKPVLFEDGTQWAGSQMASALATQAQALYGARWHEFTDELPGTAYFPIAVFNKVSNFNQGTVVTRFAIVGGDTDTEAGLMFNYQPNGDFMVLRMDSDESSLKLYQWSQGQQSALRIVENVPAALARWHDLQLTVLPGGTHVTGGVDGQTYFDEDLTAPISGKVGVWSKTDSVVVFDTFAVDPDGR